MEGFIDIHSHLLPGVDDGAADREEAEHMLETAAAEGIKAIILTPHQKPGRRSVSVQGIIQRAGSLQEWLQEKKPELTLYPGGELFYRQGLAQELQRGETSVLAGSRYVLVEFFPEENFHYLRDGLYELQAAGYLPILAHAERYPQAVEQEANLEELLDMGCYLQINAGSLLGTFGRKTRKTAWRLVKLRAAHFVATDAHRAEGNRTQALAACARLLNRKCGEAYAGELLTGNPAKVLADEEI